MFNPIQRIKDIIELVRNPPGDPVAACEITPDCVNEIVEIIGEENRKYAKLGHFYLIFEDTTPTIVPPKDFHKYYAFEKPAEPNVLTPVRQIKPL